jgi:hypothetical protein
MWIILQYTGGLEFLPERAQVSRPDMYRIPKKVGTCSWIL